MAGLILRFYGWLFHFLLALSLLALALLSLLAGQPLKLEMLPWKDETLTRMLLGGSLAGLLALLLAAFTRIRVFYPLWALIVLVMMIRGFFLSPYVFDGPSGFGWTVLLTLGALVAFLASLTVFRKPKRRGDL